MMIYIGQQVVLLGDRRGRRVEVVRVDAERVARVGVGREPLPAPHISAHADGERRGTRGPIRRYLKTRLAETFPTPPSDAI